MRQPPTAQDFTSPVHHTRVVGPGPGRNTWLGGVVVAHDAVIAPAAVLIGLAVFTVLPRRLRPPMRVAALAVATVALIGVPLLMTR